MTEARKPTPDEESLLVAYLDRAEPAQWLAFMRWAAPELARKNQRLLAELLCREAERRAVVASCGTSRHVAGDHLGSLLAELGLHLTSACPPW